MMIYALSNKNVQNGLSGSYIEYVLKKVISKIIFIFTLCIFFFNLVDN